MPEGAPAGTRGLRPAAERPDDAWNDGIGAVHRGAQVRAEPADHHHVGLLLKGVRRRPGTDRADLPAREAVYHHRTDPGGPPRAPSGRIVGERMPGRKEPGRCRGGEKENAGEWTARRQRFCARLMKARRPRIVWE